MGCFLITQIVKNQALNLLEIENILDCWHNGEYFTFFIEYLQNHVYIKSKSMVKDYFKKIELDITHINEYLRKFLSRQNRYIIKAKELAYIEHYGKKTYKRTKKVQDPEPLIKEFKKIRFKR